MKVVKQIIMNRDFKTTNGRYYLFAHCKGRKWVDLIRQKKDTPLIYDIENESLNTHIYFIFKKIKTMHTLTAK